MGKAREKAKGAFANRTLNYQTARHTTSMVYHVTAGKLYVLASDQEGTSREPLCKEASCLRKRRRLRLCPRLINFLLRKRTVSSCASRNLESGRVNHVRLASRRAKSFRDLLPALHRQLLWKWLRSPGLAAVWVAPPCDTASRAREIPLEGDSAPQPLKTPECLEDVCTLSLVSCRIEALARLRGLGAGVALGSARRGRRLHLLCFCFAKSVDVSKQLSSCGTVSQTGEG